jgi:hypothetical protein
VAGQSLSLCMTASSASARVQALLGLLRPHVDEIVLSVDARGDLDTLDACADLADRRLVHELDRNPNWLASWIQHQCSGDWILRLDDDELPSAALIERLPELIAERYATVWRIPRLWLVASDRYVVGFPWAAETVGRLVRNRPDLWHLDGEPHSEGRLEGERRFAAAPIYHLDPVLTSLEQRRAKVERYRNDTATAVCEGVDVNRYYLPEEWRGLETAAVPAAERARIELLIDPPEPIPPSTDGPAVEHADERQIARWNRRRARLANCAGSVKLISRRVTCPPATRRHFQIEVANSGSETWWRMLPPLTHPVGVTWRWLDAVGGQVGPPDGVGLTMTVFPGQRELAWITPRTPADEGEYELEVRLAHEGKTGFGAPARMAVAIERTDAALLPDTVDLDSQRELALIERERAVERAWRAQHAFMATKRYRLAVALARPLDRLRELARARRG